ncbi:MAG: hypothetical protein U9N59_06025 [Campylobacterota bacterium]|nr:hypothetical protein [Campylobacterota bacterium]
MKLFLITFLITSSLFATGSVAKFGVVNGEVYVLRHGKLLKAFHGFKIDEYDIIYSKSFSKTNVIFANNIVININGRKTIIIKKFMNENKILSIKTTKQLKQEEIQRAEKETDSYKYNSKFYKQMYKREQREYEKRAHEFYIDEKNNIIVNSKTENINNISDGTSNNINIGNVNIDSKSDVKNIIIRGTSNDVSNFSKGQGTSSTVEIGNINVK